jgi:hypothetical protein
MVIKENILYFSGTSLNCCFHMHPSTLEKCEKEGRIKLQVMDVVQTPGIFLFSKGIASCKSLGNGIMQIWLDDENACYDVKYMR